MARIRTVKPQFFLNEDLAELPAMVRLLFIGLWTQADREGRLIERPKRLKAEIFPYDNFDMEKGLKQLSDAGFILRYKVNANGSARILAPEQPKNELALIQIVNFSKHQKIDIANEKESELPTYSQGYQKTINSLPKDEERKGREEEKGKEGKGREPCEGAEKSFDLKTESEEEKKDCPAPEILQNPFSDGFLTYWDLWKKFKKEQFNFQYKSIVSEQAALNELVKLSDGNEPTAIEIINQSLTNGWKGLFELKKEVNGHSKKNGSAKSGTKITGEQLNEAFAKFHNQG